MAPSSFASVGLFLLPGSSISTTSTSVLLRLPLFFSSSFSSLLVFALLRSLLLPGSSVSPFSTFASLHLTLFSGSSVSSSSTFASLCLLLLPGSSILYNFTKIDTNQITMPSNNAIKSACAPCKLTFHEVARKGIREVAREVVREACTVVNRLAIYFAIKHLLRSRAEDNLREIVRLGKDAIRRFVNHSRMFATCSRL